VQILHLGGLNPKHSYTMTGNVLMKVSKGKDLGSHDGFLPHYNRLQYILKDTGCYTIIINHHIPYSLCVKKDYYCTQHKHHDVM